MTRGEICKEKLVKLFHIIFLIMFTWIGVLIMRKLLLWSSLATMLVVVGVVISFCVVIRMQGWFKESNDTKIWLGVQLLSAIFMFVMIFELEVQPTWDWGQLTMTASNYVLTGKIDNVGYFARYPNNKFWLSFLIIFFRVIKTFYKEAVYQDFKVVSMVVSGIIVQMTIFFTYKTGCVIFNKKKALAIGIASSLCIPIYLYAMFIYTDTIGVFIAVLILFLYSKIKNNTNKVTWIYTVLLGVLAALAIQIKITVFIVFIAVIVDVFFSRITIQKILIKGCVVFVAMSIMMFVAGSWAERQVVIDEKMVDAYQFPPTHWVMMSLSPISEGGYVQEDVDYTSGFGTYDEKKEANIKEIKNRINDMGIAGISKQIFVTKLSRTWCDSCFHGDNYVGRYPVKQGIFQEIFTTSGKHHGVCLIYSWIYYIMAVVGILLSAILSFRQKPQEQKMLVGRIAIFGMAVFQMIWECNARYLYVFLPIIILTAADGFDLLRKKIHKNRDTFDSIVDE